MAVGHVALPENPTSARQAVDWFPPDLEPRTAQFRSMGGPEVEIAEKQLLERAFGTSVCEMCVGFSRGALYALQAIVDARPLEAKVKA